MTDRLVKKSNQELADSGQSELILTLSQRQQELTNSGVAGRRQGRDGVKLDGATQGEGEGEGETG